MTPPTTGDGQFSALAERATSNPDAVSVEELATALRADPPDRAQRARDAFLAVVRADPACAQPAVNALVPLVDVEGVSRPAAGALAAVAEEYPERLTGVIAPLLDLAERDDEYVRTRAFSALEPLAAARPAELVPDALPLLRRNLAGDLFTKKGPALAVTAQIAREEPGAIATLTPELNDLVALEPDVDTDSEYFAELPNHMQSQLQEDEVRWMRLRMIAALTLVEIASVEPERLDQVLDSLIDRLPDESNVTVREATYDVVWHVSQTRPETAQSAIEPLAGRLSSEEDAELRGKVARALAMLADSFPDAVVDAVESEIATLRAMLDADDRLARAGAVGVLSYVAEVRPALVEPSSSQLLALAVDGPTSVRGNAIWALAFVGGDEAAAELRELAASDPDESIRSVASAALDRKDDR